MLLEGRNMVNFIILRYRTIHAHENAIWCLVVRGEHLYSGSADRTVCAFEFVGGKVESSNPD